MKNWYRKQEGRKRRVTPAALGLCVFLTFCIGLLVWDVAENGWAGSLTAEQPVVNLPAEEPDGPALPVTAPPAAAEAAADDVSAAASVFAAYRMDRETARSEELALLQTIIEDEGGSPTIREEAEQRRLTIAANVEQEAQAENLLDAKGFGETVVMVGETQATVICTVELDDAAATQIAETVAAVCGVGFENVVIVNR